MIKLSRNPWEGRRLISQLDIRIENKNYRYLYILDTMVGVEVDWFSSKLVLIFGGFLEKVIIERIITDYSKIVLYQWELEEVAKNNGYKNFYSDRRGFSWWMVK